MRSLSMSFVDDLIVFNVDLKDLNFWSHTQVTQVKPSHLPTHVYWPLWSCLKGRKISVEMNSSTVSMYTSRTGSFDWNGRLITLLWSSWCWPFAPRLTTLIDWSWPFFSGRPLCSQLSETGGSPVVTVHVIDARIPSCRFGAKLNGIIEGLTAEKKVNLVSQHCCHLFKSSP